jgi:metal-responsive CopG/Arc/MetJ family transcriptional regulator
MERLTISVSNEFAAELAAFMESYKYENRSEAVRDLARLGLKRARIDHRTRGTAPQRSRMSSTTMPASWRSD